MANHKPGIHLDVIHFPSGSCALSASHNNINDRENTEGDLHQGTLAALKMDDCSPL
jgi:hypothetical protein